MTIDDCVDYILTAPEVVKNFDVVSFCKCQGKNALRFKKDNQWNYLYYINNYFKQAQNF